MSTPTIYVEVEGGEELLRKLRKLGLDVEDVLEAAALAGGEVIADAANVRAPAPEIEAETAEKRKGRVSVDVGPPEEKWFWRFLETGAQPHEISGAPLVFEGDLGTVVVYAVDHPGIMAEPFLRPALDEEEDAATDAVGDRIRQAIRR